MSLYEFYMRMSSNGRAPASQAGDAGSIPVIRSKKQLQNHLGLQLFFLFLRNFVRLLSLKMSRYGERKV